MNNIEGKIYFTNLLITESIIYILEQPIENLSIIFTGECKIIIINYIMFSMIQLRCPLPTSHSTGSTQQTPSVKRTFVITKSLSRKRICRYMGVARGGAGKTEILLPQSTFIDITHSKKYSHNYNVLIN